MNSMDRELIEAARENNMPDVRRLLRAGADVNASRYGRTPLIAAIFHGHVQVVKELLEYGADTEARENGNGWTHLHFACFNGHLAVVIELLSPSNGTTTTILDKRKSRGGADIDAKDYCGNTPLHYASLYNHVPIVKALLAAGADCRVANNDGQLPIHRAMSGRKSEASKHLLQHFYATTRRLPLHKLLEDLMWIGDPSSIGIDGPPLRAALHQDVLRTDAVVEILEFLVDRNPELLSSRDHDGLLPLHVACRRGTSFTVVQSLVDHYKASVKSRTPQGDLPLFLACEMPEPSLDTIFILVKLYPDLICR
jgi:ankyrin repeat protein